MYLLLTHWACHQIECGVSKTRMSQSHYTLDKWLSAHKLNLLFHFGRIKTYFNCNINITVSNAANNIFCHTGFKERLHLLNNVLFSFSFANLQHAFMKCTEPVLRNTFVVPTNNNQQWTHIVIRAKIKSILAYEWQRQSLFSFR